MAEEICAHMSRIGAVALMYMPSHRGVAMSASADAIAKAYLQAPNVEDVSIGETVRGRCVRWEVRGTTGEWACVDKPTYRLAKERMHIRETHEWKSPDIMAVRRRGMGRWRNGWGAHAQTMKSCGRRRERRLRRARS